MAGEKKMPSAQEEMSSEVKTEEHRKHSWHWINREWTATLVCSGLILFLVAFVLTEYETVGEVFSYVFDVLRPIIIGCVIALLLYRPTCRFEQSFQKIKAKHPKFPAVGMAVFCAYLLAIIIIAFLLWIVIPSFIESILDLTDNIMIYYNKFIHFINSSEYSDEIQDIMDELGLNFSDIRSAISELTSYIPDALSTVLSTVGNWAGSLIGAVFDFAVGAVFSVYLLAGRHKLKRQAQRVCRHYLSEKHYTSLAHYSSLIFETFSNFISGQLMDAFCLGLLIFCCMSIGGLEYALMISVILGVTNMIPYVGPWLGTIPCAIILLFINPWHAVAFVIMVIVCQQVDSNFIYPRVVGSSVGLPAMWVLFAITVGGGLGGVIGMIVAVPIMSVIYAVLKEKTAEGTESAPVTTSKRNNQSITKTVVHLYHKIRDFVVEKKAAKAEQTEESADAETEILEETEGTEDTQVEAYVADASDAEVEPEDTHREP